MLLLNILSWNNWLWVYIDVHLQASRFTSTGFRSDWIRLFNALAELLLQLAQEQLEQLSVLALAVWHSY